MRSVMRIIGLSLLLALVLSVAVMPAAFAACTSHSWGISDQKNGYHSWVCENDGCTAALGLAVHQFNDWQIIEHNTETTDGYMVRWCQDCNLHEKKVIKAGAPLTGDENNVMLYGAVSLASLMGLAGTAALLKRREN